MDTQDDDLKRVEALLLRSRAELLAQVSRVEGALLALGVDLDDPTVTDTSPERWREWAALSHTHTQRAVQPPPEAEPADESRRGSGSVARTARPAIRPLVLEVTEFTDRWMTSAEITKRVLELVSADDRPVDKIKANVRSSLWSLSKHKDLVNQDGKYKATKWLNDTDAATEVGSETASGSIPTREEGGGTDEDAVRDLGSLGTSRGQDHRLGASVVGAPS